MFHVVLPANVLRYLEMIKPIVTYDFLPTEKINSWLFSFDMEKQRELQEGLFDQMEDLGYSSHNSILILSSVWIYALGYLVLLGVYLTFNQALKLKDYKLFSKIKFFEGGSPVTNKHFSFIDEV